PGQRPGGLVAPPPVEAPATPGELGGASSYWVRCDLCGFAEPGRAFDQAMNNCQRLSQPESSPVSARHAAAPRPAESQGRGAEVLRLAGAGPLRLSAPAPLDGPRARV